MGLQVWLPLNKDTRNNGLSNSTVINSGATLEDNGVFDKCYNITLGKYLGLDAPNVNNHKYSPISIALWVYPTLSDSTERYIIGCWESGGCGLFLKSQKVGMYAYVGGSYKICSSTTIVTLNTWHHVCSTYDNETLKLYLDGQQVATVVTYGPITYNNTTPWQIGGNPLPGEFLSGNFVGKINDVRIYDHCITPEDVKRIYNCKIMDVCASSYNGGFFYDNSGLIINDLVSTGITYSGNSMYFNGTTTQIRPSQNNVGLNISGGTLSVWLKPLSKPSDFRIVYIDSKSKMALGFFSINYFIVVTDNAGLKPIFSNDSLIYNQLNNVIISYDQSYNPLYCYINGVKAATGSTNSWTESSGLTIGGRQYNTANKFNGYISKVTVYKNQLTEDEAKQLYAIGPQTETDFSKNYTRLEYIQATGTQYINTECFGDATTTITLDYEYQELKTGIGIIGTGMGSTTEPMNGFRFYYTGGNNKFYVSCYSKLNASTLSSTPLIYINQKYHSVMYGASGVVITNGQSTTVSSYGAGSNNTYQMVLFKPYIACTKAKLYKCIISKNGIYEREFIPAKRKSDNVIGLYDLVSNTFFTNAGTGTFTAGPAI